jgi:hypothetical protein
MWRVWWKREWIQDFGVKTLGKSQLLKHGARLEYIIKMDLHEIGWEHVLN